MARGRIGAVDRILVVKLADLGDVLTATPAIRALRLAHPSAHLGALITPKSTSILEGTDLVDEIIPFEKASFDRPLSAGSSLPTALGLARRLRAGRWDAMALFHHLTTPFGVAKYAALCLASGARRIAGLDNGWGRFLTDRVTDDGFGARHEADYWLAVAGLLGGHHPAPRYELPIGDTDRAWAAEQIARLGPRGAGLLAIHPGSGAFSLARRWPAERFAAVVRGLRVRHDLRPMVIQGPGPDEGMLARTVAVGASGAVIVGPAPSIGALVALLEGVRLFIGNESGVMHLAVAACAPIVAVFGPTNDRAWGPYPLSAPRHAVVREVLACTPCVHRGHALGTPAGCAARTCLDLVEPSAVIAAAARVLAATEDSASGFDVREPVVLGAS
jgi:ADP-heptose:LPS heptosyltransferase